MSLGAKDAAIELHRGQKQVVKILAHLRKKWAAAEEHLGPGRTLVLSCPVTHAQWGLLPPDSNLRVCAAQLSLRRCDACART